MTLKSALARHFATLTIVTILATISWAGTVQITTPTNGSSVTSPVHVHATYSGSAKYMKLFLDGKSNVIQSNTSTFDASVPMSTGSHRLVIQASDSSSGTVYSSAPVNVTVQAATSGQVTITSPVNNSSVSSPVHIHATYNGSASYMKLWVDHVDVNQIQHNTSTYDLSVALTNGSHLLEVQAADASSGTVFTSAVNINVGTTGTTVTVSPSTTTVAPGGTQQFTANVPVTWTAAGDGTINSSGLFTAGSSSGSATVTATATDGSGATGTATVTVSSSTTPTVTFVTPTNGATVTSPVHIRFTYNKTASYMKLWVDGVAQTAQHDPQVYDISISLSNGSHKLQGQAHDATAGITYTTTENITVSGTGTSLTVSPSSATVAQGGTQQFTANVPVTWSATGDGAINSSGLFTAGSSDGSATITATATDGSGATVTANVTVGNGPPPATGNYTTWKNDNLRTGSQTNEAQLTPSNVNSTSFGVKFSVSVDAAVYAQPLYMSGLTINGATHNVVFVATQKDSVYAFDADSSGSPLWKKSLLNGGVPIPQANVGSTIYGGIGITSTPVIDPSTNTIYVLSEDLENSTNYVFRLHALDVTTGNEKFGGPVVVSDPNFQPKEQLQRSALLLANGNIYFAFASQGDHTPWHGWIFAYTAGGLSKVAAYNATSTGSAGGIWGGGNAIGADSDGNIYAATGNGSWNGTTNLSMSYIKFSPNLSVIDYFTPFNEQTLSNGDRDLGSGGFLLVPDQSGAHPHELIGCGKPTPIYVVDRDDMGHLHSGVDSQIIQELPNVVGGTSGTQSNDHCFTSPAYWNGNLYFVGNNDVVKAFTLDPSTGTLSSSPTSQGSFTFGFPGGQPVVSSNGSSNGIVWVVDRTAAALHAYDASDLSKSLYTSGSLGTGTKWSTPTVINGKVYVGTSSKLYVFALK